MKPSMNDQEKIKKPRKKKVELPTTTNEYLIDQVELGEKKEESKEITKVQRLSIPTGNKLWEIDLTTQEIREAEITIVEGNKSAFKKEKCLYIVALNPKNAMRKIANKMAEYKKMRNI